MFTQTQPTEQKNSQRALQMLRSQKIKAIVIGASAGGIEVVSHLLEALNPRATFCLILGLHLPSSGHNVVPQVLSHHCPWPLKEAESTEHLIPGQVYLAPSNYHLSVESDQTVSLSQEEPVMYSRPSIDVLFESAAKAFQTQLAGILLTGANADGAKGLYKIQKRGGITVIQDPETAVFPTMPKSAMELFHPDFILPESALRFILARLTE